MLDFGRELMPAIVINLKVSSDFLAFLKKRFPIDATVEPIHNLTKDKFR